MPSESKAQPPCQHSTGDYVRSPPWIRTTNKRFRIFRVAGYTSGDYRRLLPGALLPEGTYQPLTSRAYNVPTTGFEPVTLTFGG